MPNVTLSIDEELLKAGRDYARKHNTSLNKLIRDMLKSKISLNRHTRSNELFQLMDDASGKSHGQSWTRDEIYKR